jgi:hypothetical protein
MAARAAGIAGQRRGAERLEGATEVAEPGIRSR